MEREQSNYKVMALKYKDDVMKLAAYIPWFEQNSFQNVTKEYTTEGLENTMSFPVYDGTLLRFVKEAKKTQFMNRNYPYVYTRNRIKNSTDELKIIKDAAAKDFDILAGILSRYVLLGMTKGTLWNEGTYNGVFLNLILKMKEIVEFWSMDKINV